MNKNDIQYENLLKVIMETKNSEYVHLQVDTITIREFSTYRKIILTFKINGSFVDYKGIVSLENAIKIINKAKSVFGNKLDLDGTDLDSEVYFSV